MSTHRFSTGKQFVWRSATYEVKRLLPGSRLNVEKVQTGEMCVVSFGDLAQALFSGELYFIGRGKQTGQATAQGQADLSDYLPHLRELAEYRLAVIRPLLSLSANERTRSVVAARVAEVRGSQQSDGKFSHTSLSVASVYRWMKDYTESGNDIRSLVGNSQRQGGKEKLRLEEEVEAIIRTVIADRYLVAEKVTTEDIYLEVMLRIEEENRFRREGEKLSGPSRTTLWRRIDAWDEKEKLIAKRGKQAAEQQLTQYGQMNYPTVPLERVEIDHTRLDVIVVDGQDNLPIGRPTFTYCLDTATRYPLGFYIGFDPPSYLTVMECLHHAILTKGDVRAKYGTQHDWMACGIPSALIVDNGKEFIGVDLQDACLSLGIELEQMPVKTPHFKATVERMFGTVNTGLLHTLPGTTFSMLDRQREYKSEQEACITLEELTRIFHLFLLDVYAESFHRGLGDIPARRWEEIIQGGFFPRLPADVPDLKILLGRVAYRQVLGSGIHFLTLRYNSPDLVSLRTHLRGERAKIKFDPADLGCIYVYNAWEQAYIQVECLDRDYAQGLSLWKHRVIQNLARRDEDKVDILALARAKRKIQEIVQESRSDKKIKSRTRVARWKAGSKSTQQAEEQAGLPPGGTIPLLPGPRPDSSSPALDLAVNLQDLENEGWSAGYDLPIAEP